jgi:hypothetical protein
MKNSTPVIFVCLLFCVGGMQNAMELQKRPFDINMSNESNTGHIWRTLVHNCGDKIYACSHDTSGNTPFYINFFPFVGLVIIKL